MGSGGGRGPMSTRATPQCTPRNSEQSCGSRSRGNGSVCRPSPLLSPESLRRERDALRAELEDARRRFAVEVRELREAAARDQQLLADKLHSKGAQQRARELQKIGEETKKQREAEIRQLLRWKQAELQESQEFLKRERDAAVRQARELQRQLAKELVLRGSGSRGGSGGVPSAQCQARLTEVLGKLRWEVDSDQAARIRHLEAELELERSLFLRYILGRFEGEHLPTGSPHSFRQASLPPEGTANSWGAAGEHTQEGLPQPGQLPGGSSNQQDTGQLDALPALGERCTQLKDRALLRENSFADIQESNLRVSEPPGPLNFSGRELFRQVFAQQDPKALDEQASALLAKDQKIEALQKERQALQAELNALNVLKERCTHLEEENNWLRKKNSFPGMQEKAKRLKRKSADLAVLAQRLVEAVKKLQNTSSRMEKHSLAKISDLDLSLSQRDMLELQRPIALHEKQQLEFVCEKTLPKLQKKEDEIEPLQQAPVEITREHHGEVQFLPTQEKELEPLYPRKTEYVNQHPFRLRCFLARYSYDPLNVPNENPETELPLTAGEYVYVCGDMDEDGFYVGELTDGRRGFVPSNLVEEVDGNDLFSFIPSEPSDISCHSFHEPRFSCPSAVWEGKSNSPDGDRHVSLLPDGPKGTLGEVRAAVPDLQNLTLLTLLNITTRSAEIAWFPNDTHAHLVHLDEKKYCVTKAGIDCYTFQNLQPSTTYRVKVEPLLPQEALVSPQGGLQEKAREMTFTTPSAGPPHAPLDVQVEAGSSAGFLVISWFPETIHPSGSSNGVQVTGYAIYFSGQKVTEIMSPTAGSVSLDVSQIKASQGPLAVTVRTVSPFGESADSVPALIPPDLQKVLSTVSPQSVAPGLTSKEFSDSEGQQIPATEDTDKDRSEASLTPNRIVKSKPDDRKVCASLDVSQRNVFQGPQAVTVRTVSPFGESADSVPASVPPDLRKLSNAILSPSVPSGPTSQDFFESEGRPVPAPEDTDKEKDRGVFASIDYTENQPRHQNDDSQCSLEHPLNE